VKKNSPKLKNLFIFFAFIITLIAITTVGYYRYMLSPANPRDDRNLRITIAKGESVSEIARNLESDGIIKSSDFFKLYIRLNGLTNSIQAGEHLVSPSNTLQEIIYLLGTGKSDVWVTFPEGLRTEEVIEIIENQMSIDATEASFKGLEGKLYPDTYSFPIDADAEEIIQVLTDNYENKISPLRSDIVKTGLTEDEVISLAAIIERETLSDEEKPIVAGILLKRMNSDWALETDANIQYIIGDESEWWPIPTIEDRKIPSPYNSYLNLGLPPTPIANPGIESIKAVIYSEPSDYWFYLHDKSGNIHYGATLVDHNINIEKYIR